MQGRQVKKEVKKHQKDLPESKRVFIFALPIHAHFIIK
jgi:hypothetical protein